MIVIPDHAYADLGERVGEFHGVILRHEDFEFYIREVLHGFIPFTKASEVSKTSEV